MSKLLWNRSGFLRNLSLFPGLQELVAFWLLAYDEKSIPISRAAETGCFLPASLR